MLFKNYFPPPLRAAASPGSLNITPRFHRNKARRSEPPGLGNFFMRLPEAFPRAVLWPFPALWTRAPVSWALPSLKLPGAANRRNTKEITIKRTGRISYVYFLEGDRTDRKKKTFNCECSFEPQAFWRRVAVSRLPQDQRNPPPSPGWSP